MERWTDDEIAEVIRLRDDEHYEWTRIGEECRRPHDQCRKKYHATKGTTVTEKTTFVEKGDDAECTFLTPNRIRTLAEATRVAEIDLATWRIERWEVSNWTAPKKLKDEYVQTKQYKVSLKLKRLAPKHVLEGLDIIFDRIKAHAPQYKAASARKIPTSPHLAVFGLFDVHFGKLCWEPETGSNYDLRIAETLYANAVEDLLAVAGRREIERILLPVGNDFYHFDNPQHTTTAGTRMDTDGRLAKVFVAGKMAVVHAIERMMAIAPVDVVWVPGNHDATTSYFLIETLNSWFRNTKSVTVDTNSLSTRKYYRYGNSLLGLTHGDSEPVASLPGLMAGEARRDWAVTECHEWLTGHWHHERKWTTKETQQTDATVIRTLHSLSGTDAWHHRKGFVHAKKAAEVLYYAKDAGYVGQDIVTARLARK